MSVVVAGERGELDTSNGLRKERETWRAGFEAGQKRGALTFFQSGMMEQIGFELKLLKNLHESHCDAAEQREKLLAHWKAEAQWWREEHNKVHDEYCAFVRDMARRFGRGS